MLSRTCDDINTSIDCDAKDTNNDTHGAVLYDMNHRNKQEDASLKADRRDYQFSRAAAMLRVNDFVRFASRSFAFA